MGNAASGPPTPEMAMGLEVTMFFTFYGLPLLLKKLDLKVTPLGNAAMMASIDVDPADGAARAEVLRGEGQTVMFVAIDGAFAGLIGVADPVGSRD